MGANALVGDLAIAGVTADSRQVRPGYLFAALPGLHGDGRAHIADAVARGAVAVLAPNGTAWPAGVPPRRLIAVAEPRRTLAQLAADHAGAQPETVVAITGTNGKTSTAEFLRQIWALGGTRAASLGTLGVRAPDWRTETGLTTPDPTSLAATLARLANEAVRCVSMEASSHGLHQFRLDGVRLAGGAFTSLSRDHLDYHGTDAAYRAAKLRLFRELLPEDAAAVVSSELDVDMLDLLRDIARTRRLRLQVVGPAGDAMRLRRVIPHPGGQVLEIEVGHVHRSIDIVLPGRFQADNVLIAATLAQALGARNALDLLPRLIGVRGRMELAATLGNGAAVYIDYAHTPDAITRLLAALRPHSAGRLHIVFGAGGDRDRGKRPLMGAAAAAGADRVIVTDDNPRGEDPAAIRAEIMAGCPDAVAIAGRQAAIAAALQDLRPGDVLAVAGKGHEQGQIVGDQVLPFDDVAVVRRLVGIG